MGLFNTLTNVVKSYVGIVDDKLKDPVRDTKVAIQDSKKEIASFESEIASLMASNKVSKGKLSGALQEVKKWQDISKKAAEAGAENDVRDAVTKRQSSEAEVKALQEQVTRNEMLIDQQKKLLTDQRGKVARAESNLSSLTARQKGAELRKGMTDAGTSFGKGRGLNALDELESSVASAEAEAEALEEMSGEGAAAENLENKYSETSDTAVDDEVAALMGGRAKKAAKKTGKKR